MPLHKPPPASLSGALSTGGTQDLRQQDDETNAPLPNARSGFGTAASAAAQGLQALSLGPGRTAEEETPGESGNAPANLVAQHEWAQAPSAAASAAAAKLGSFIVSPPASIVANAQPASLPASAPDEAVAASATSSRLQAAAISTPGGAAESGSLAFSSPWPSLPAQASSIPLAPHLPERNAAVPPQALPFPASSRAVPEALSDNTMNQNQQYAPPRRQGAYGAQQDELHIPGGMSQHGQMSPREYATSSSSAPHIKLEQASPNAAQYQSPSSVPGVLQPGGMAGRPPALSANTAPIIPILQGSMSHQQPQDYQTPSKPSSLSMSHSHSRSSPAAPYDGPSGYSPYTPTTPGGSGVGSSSQYMSPTDTRYMAPGSQRNISNTPLGLADIRPRANSSLSDGMPGTSGYELANTQPGLSNYLAPWALYAFDWCKWPPQGNGAGKVAIGSYLEDGHNFIQILDTQLTPTPPEYYQPGGSKYNLEFTKIAEATHSYPVTRLLWEPPSPAKQTTDLLATSGDHLRLWSLPSETPVPQSNSINNRNRDIPMTKLTPLALLSNSKTPDHTAPLTSLDWNQVSPSLIITSSIDTTCTIWDIPSLTAKTQLIAHDKEVYDVRFCANSTDVFVSCGQDGSVRMFDLRSLEHSTIIYEPTGRDERDANGGRVSPTTAQQTMAHPPPLLRLATSPHDAHLLATFAQDSNIIRILDVRQPGQALLELRGHGGAVNCIEWSPHRRGTLASGGDDCQVLIWDLMTQSASGPSINGTSQQDSIRSPTASWQCDYEIGNLGYVPHISGDNGDWLGVSAGRAVWGVHM